MDVDIDFGDLAWIGSDCGELALTWVVISMIWREFGFDPVIWHRFGC